MTVSARWDSFAAVLPAAYPLLEELHPDGARELARLDAAAWACAERGLLALCSQRAAQLLGAETAVAAEPSDAAIDPAKRAELEEWDRSSAFSDAERAHLAFTEQFVTSVGHVSDEQVAALLRHRSPDEVRTFVAALYAVELVQRLDLVAGAVLDAGEVAA